MKKLLLSAFVPLFFAPVAHADDFIEKVLPHFKFFQGCCSHHGGMGAGFCADGTLLSEQCSFRNKLLKVDVWKTQWEYAYNKYLDDFQSDLTSQIRERHDRDLERIQSNAQSAISVEERDYFLGREKRRLARVYGTEEKNFEDGKIFENESENAITFIQRKIDSLNRETLTFLQIAYSEPETWGTNEEMEALAPQILRKAVLK